MGLDIRLPIGLLFTLLGAVLVVYGLIADRAVYARSLGYNVNAVWGSVLLVFGIALLLLSRRHRAVPRPAEETPEGRKTEELEHEEGLERE